MMLFSSDTCQRTSLMTSSCPRRFLTQPQEEELSLSNKSLLKSIYQWSELVKGGGNKAVDDLVLGL